MPYIRKRNYARRYRRRPAYTRKRYTRPNARYQMKQNTQLFNVVKKISYSTLAQWGTTQEETGTKWVDTLFDLTDTHADIFMTPMSKIFDGYKIKGIGCKITAFNSSIKADGSLLELPGAILWLTGDRNGSESTSPTFQYEDAQGQGTCIQRSINSGSQQSVYMYLKPMDLQEATTWKQTDATARSYEGYANVGTFAPAFFFGMKFPMANGTASAIDVRFQIETTYYITFRQLNITKDEGAKLLLAPKSVPEIDIETETENEITERKLTPFKY